MTTAQIAFGAYLIAMNLVSARKSWFDFGGGAPRPPLYGIWDVETITVDGIARAPLLADRDRWRRIIISGSSRQRIAARAPTRSRLRAADGWRWRKSAGAR